MKTSFEFDLSIKIKKERGENRKSEFEFAQLMNEIQKYIRIERL
jgi:DNA-directed RNA polymerase delta subunit